jgi:uncharacterized membrane protein
LRLRSVLLAAATLSYPAISYFLLRFYGVRALLIPLCALALLRLVLKREWAWGGVLLLLAAATLLTNHSLPAKLYPVAVNVGLLTVFGHSLFNPPSFVERIARLREPALSPAAVQYTRRVTMVWCGFFIVNGVIAAWIAISGTDQGWALYSGGIAYLLAGLLFAGEFAVRCYLRRKWRDV